MNTPGSVACSCIRTRSPSSAPPVNGDVGSTASTATRAVAPRPESHELAGERRLPDAGRAREADRRRPSGARHRSPADSASSSGAPSSTSEIARATARRSPASTPSISVATSTGPKPTRRRGRRGRPRHRGASAGAAPGHRHERVAERAAVLALLDQRGIVVDARPSRAPSRGSPARAGAAAAAPRLGPRPRAHRRRARRAGAVGLLERRRARSREMPAAADLGGEGTVQPSPLAPPGEDDRDRDEREQRQPLHRGRERHDQEQSAPVHGCAGTGRAAASSTGSARATAIADEARAAIHSRRRSGACVAPGDEVARRPSRRAPCTARGSTARSPRRGGRTPAARRPACPPNTPMK